MAWSVSSVKKTVFGDLRVEILSCVADATTFNVQTTLSKIYGHSVSPVSCAGVGKVYANSGAIGTALTGVLGCSGFTSGDVLYITVFGV